MGMDIDARLVGDLLDLRRCVRLVTARARLRSRRTALDFREQLGGEERVMRHNHDLAVRGGEAMAKILGTEVLENEEKSLTAAMVRSLRSILVI